MSEKIHFKKNKTNKTNRTKRRSDGKRNKSKNRTLKKKTKKNGYKLKKKLWDKFDEEIPCIFKKTVKNQILENDENILNNLDDSIKTCDICDYPLLITEYNFLTCSNKKCGKLYTDVLDDGAEWRYYGANDNSRSDPTRCGMPINPLLKESSFSCTVRCNYRSTYEMRKIKRYTEWQSMPYKEKSQYDEFEKIKALSAKSGLSKYIVDEALIYHKKISENKTFRGCNRQGIIAASIYIACRKNNVPRTPKEIAKIFNLNSTDATKGCKNALHIINNLDKNSEEKTTFYKTTPSSFIERYCSKLNLNKEMTELCKFIANNIERGDRMEENTPHSVAGGIIYFVAKNCNLNITKKSIYLISQISEVTINKCYKKLENIKSLLIPDKILKKYS